MAASSRRVGGPDQAQGLRRAPVAARARAADASGRAKLAAELKEWVRSRLSKHKYPRWVAFVDDVPKNDRGKVDKETLKALEAAGDNPRGD